MDSLCGVSSQLHLIWSRILQALALGFLHRMLWGLCEGLSGVISCACFSTRRQHSIVNTFDSADAKKKEIARQEFLATVAHHGQVRQTGSRISHRGSELSIPAEFRLSLLFYHTRITHPS